MRFALVAFAAALAVPAFSAPPPAPEFNQPQSPTKPPPFEVKLVDAGKTDPRLKGIRVPEGFTVDIVADAPTVVNPVGMTFAPDGTLFVLEWRPDPGREWQEMKETIRYRDGTTRQIATMKKFTTDTVKVLRLNPKTNTYDKAETILAEELPSSILWHDGWLYVSGRGTLRRYKQSRPGGPWDVREVIAQGFCGFHHHQVSGLSIGNDGLLYITSGDDDNFVEGSDGTRATVLRTGAVFRCRPDGSNLETFSIGYRNPYRDLAHDANYNWFHSDNDNEDGSKFTGCRLVHVADGVDYGWRLLPGARCCRPDPIRGAVAGELPGKVAPMVKTGRGAPAGVLIYSDTQIPEQYRGLMYYPDVFRKNVRAYSLKANGASFAITNEFEFMTADDPLFRPCQMIVGPDGAIYVCDWRTDSGGAGKLWGDGVHGRIYRLRWTGTEASPAIPLRGLDTWAKLLKASDDDLFEKLGSDDMTVRVEARKELVRRGSKVRDAVLQRFVDGKWSDAARPTAFGVLAAQWSPEIAELALALAKDTDPTVRRLAVEALGQHASRGDIRVQEVLIKRFADDDRAVRRAAALAIGRLGADGAGDALVTVWRQDDSQDPFLLDGYLRAIEKLGKPGMAALLALAGSGQADDLSRVVFAFTGFRSPAAATALPELLGNVHLTDEQRADLIRSYTNYQFDPPLSLEPLAEMLADRAGNSAAVSTAALGTLAAADGLNGPKATALVLALLDAKNADVRLAAVKAVEEARLGAAGDKLIEALADDRRPASERIAVLKALKVTGSGKAVQPLQEVLAAEAPASLKVEALRALAAISPEKARPIAEGLLEQPDPALIAEAVMVLGSTKDGAKLVGQRFLAKKLPADLFPRVSEILRKFPDDAAISALNGQVMKGALTLSLDPAMTDKVRKLVNEVGDPKKGKALYLNTAVLACATCHRMEGVGGSVGPDLTRLWDTMTVEKLVESVVEPSKEIKEGYQTFKATTADGRVFTGLKITDTPKEVVIREANGRDVRLAKADVDELTAVKSSLMPADAIAQLTFDQFIDLLAFLKSRSSQESLRGNVREVNVAVGFPADLKLDPPSGISDPSTKLPAGIAWQPAAADVAGLVNLKPLLPAEPTGVYVLSFVYSPKKQSAKAVLLGDDPVRIWVAGEKVFERKVAKLNRFSDEETFTLDLPAGWSPVLVQAVSTGQTHKLGLTIQAPEVRTAAKPEEK